MSRSKGGGSINSGKSCFSGDMLLIVDSKAPSISSCIAAIFGLVGGLSGKDGRGKGDTGRGPIGRFFFGDSEPRYDGVMDRYVG